MPAQPANHTPYRTIEDVDFGEGVTVFSFTNLYGCRIGDRSRIGAFVEIQRGAVIGSDCKVQSHAFVCDGVTIGDGVFVGHGALFVNDKTPRVLTEEGRPQTSGDWELLPIAVGSHASIGSGAIVLGGVSVGERALVGAGAVVTRDVPADTVVAGVPARVIRQAAARTGAGPAT